MTTTGPGRGRMPRLADERQRRDSVQKRRVGSKKPEMGRTATSDVAAIATLHPLSSSLACCCAAPSPLFPPPPLALFFVPCSRRLRRIRFSSLHRLRCLGVRFPFFSRFPHDYFPAFVFFRCLFRSHIVTSFGLLLFPLPLPGAAVASFRIVDVSCAASREARQSVGRGVLRIGTSPCPSRLLGFSAPRCRAGFSAAEFVTSVPKSLPFRVGRLPPPPPPAYPRAVAVRGAARKPARRSTVDRCEGCLEHAPAIARARVLAFALSRTSDARRSSAAAPLPTSCDAAAEAPRRCASTFGNGPARGRNAQFKQPIGSAATRGRPRRRIMASSTFEAFGRASLGSSSRARAGDLGCVSAMARGPGRGVGKGGGGRRRATGKEATVRVSRALPWRVPKPSCKAHFPRRSIQWDVGPTMVSTKAVLPCGRGEAVGSDAGDVHASRAIPRASPRAQMRPAGAFFFQSRLPFSFRFRICTRIRRSPLVVAPHRRHGFPLRARSPRRRARGRVRCVRDDRPSERKQTISLGSVDLARRDAVDRPPQLGI